MSMIRLYFSLPRGRRAALAGLAVAVSACSGGGGGGGGGGTDPVVVDQVVVSAPATSLRVGRTLALTATARAQGNAVAGKTPAWSSDRADVASVASDGTVTGVAPGSATITATVDGIRGSVALTVTPEPVATVTVSAATQSLPAGGTLQLTAVARDSAGGALSGRLVAWTTNHAEIASVSLAGVVTGVAPGTATITATVEGVQGSLAVTVTQAAVATVTIVPDSAIIVPGQTRQLAAVARDALGNALTGRPVTWNAPNPGVATLSAAGVLAGVAPGTEVVTATVEGKVASALVTVVPQVAARVVISPRLAVVSTGVAVPLKAAAYTAAGDSVLLPQVTWTALDAGISVTADGVANAAAAGTYRVVAAVNAARDTATVAALGPSSLLVTALPQGQALVDVQAGAAFDVPVVVDLSRASSTGDLGSLQLDVTFDSGVMVYDGFFTVARGATEANSPSAGTVRVAFAETSPQGTGTFTLVVLHFHL
ncbi:MAG TPA: Ig-like domain-containing protein, partial [Longimicrobiaceae bacterium]|nr:Ig-like domain-containing protein [Longimicrobiaceae bacterium]